MVLTRSVDTDLLEALSGAFFYPVILVYLDWPENEIRLHSGVGTIEWGGEDWLGVGAFGEVRLPEEAIGLGSQPATLSLVGLPDDLDEQLEAPIRNRAGTIYFGATTERAGNVLIGEPFSIYDGYMDALTDKVEGSDGKLARRIILSLASGPSQRSYAEVYHTYEDQARAYPGPQPVEDVAFGDSPDPTVIDLANGDWDILVESEGGSEWLDVTTTGGAGWTIPDDGGDPYVRIRVYADGLLTTGQKAILLAGDTIADTAGRLTINAEAEGQKLRWPE